MCACGGMMVSSHRVYDKMSNSVVIKVVMPYVVAALFLTTLSGASAQAITTLTSTVQNATDEVTPPPVTSTINHFSNVTLQKCICGKDEVLDGEKCRQAHSPQVIPLSLGMEGFYALNTSDFSNVGFGLPECPDGQTLVSLDFSLFQFFLLSNGTLLWENEGLIIENYCYENVHHEGIVSLQAYVCIPSPPVPQCCPRGYILGPDDSCHPDDGELNFAPTVLVSMTPVQWQGYQEDVVNITCVSGSEDTQVSLSQQEGFLVYASKDQVVMAWRPLENSEFKSEIDYCVGMKRDSESGQLEYIAKFCFLDPKLEHQTTCSNITCVRKCCPNNYLLSDTSMCMDVHSENEIWQPFFHDSKALTNLETPTEDWITIHGYPLCESYFNLLPNLRDMEKFYLLSNGSLHVPLYFNSYLPTDYCVDLLLHPGFDHPINVALLCHPEKNGECQWKQTLIGVLRGVSCVFLAATLVIYLSVADLRDRTNGRCLVSMVVAMMASYMSLIVINEVPHLNNTECFVVAFVAHMNTLATFFWLNVMCFDMWSTLRSSKQQYHSLKVFRFYSLYAWGCPLLVALLGLVLDIVKPEGIIRPNFTEGTCWLSGTAEFWLYLSGFILVLVVVNLFFFLHVAVTLCQELRQRKRVLEGNASHSSKSTKTKEQAWLYVKLFIVMGVVWITDILSSIHHRNECKYWVLTDIINVLQGVFIFLVAVCNKNNIKKIRSAWQPRVQHVRQSVLTLRGRTVSSNTTRNTDLSMAVSESRKTSVTSLPRKLSAASVAHFFTGNKNRTNSGLSENSENRTSNELSPSSRKISSVSNKEHVPMETMAE